MSQNQDNRRRGWVSGPPVYAKPRIIPVARISAKSPQAEAATETAPGGSTGNSPIRDERAAQPSRGLGKLEAPGTKPTHVSAALEKAPSRIGTDGARLLNGRDACATKMLPIGQHEVKPLASVGGPEKAAAIDAPAAFPTSDAFLSTISPGAVEAVSNVTQAEAASDGETASVASKKRRKCRAKPAIDLAVIDKIVREGGRFLVDPEVAAYLNISTSVLRNWRVAGKGPKTTRIGTRAIRIDPADVREFVERGRK